MHSRECPAPSSAPAGTTIRFFSGPCASRAQRPRWPDSAPRLRVEHSDAIVFSAPAGSTVEVGSVRRGAHGEVLRHPSRTGRSLLVHRRAAGLPSPGRPWICLRAADDDPPATILAVEPRGEIAVSGSSSGYALKLEVRHPGVLRVVFDEECLREHFVYDSDAGAPIPRGEVTIR